MCSNGQAPPGASPDRRPRKSVWDFLLRWPGQQSTVDRQNGDD